MLDHPRLRAVEIFPVQQDGKTLFYLKDPQNFAQPLGISPVGYFIVSHFDGKHSLVDIQQAYNKQFGTLLLTHELTTFIDLLDNHLYLHTDRFTLRRDRIIEEFKGEDTRAAAHAGSIYSEDPDQLREQLDDYFVAPHGPGRPSMVAGAPAPRAIVAPHIDFHRGGPAYAWAYKGLSESDGADLYILLGTSHCGGENPFILTFKDFNTPLGKVETDKAFARRLQQSCREDLLADEFLHRGEHSLEFQVLFLKYIAQRRAELRGQNEKPFQIVPILVSSFHAMVLNRTLPEKHAPVATFIQALKDLVAREKRRVCFVAGVDLAHVGQQFGDRQPMTPDFLKWVETEDDRLIDRLAALDAPGFFDEIAKDQDKRRVCGFSPLYSLIQLLDGNHGRRLKYDQAFTPEAGSAVTFVSMVFD
ncbi:MAG TPA: AmmeMemoRadiSam system protein B [Candidatus Binatia bacterium]|nr:AmmeMemoRadiSam system protein B [Candidatus Binatia bacterium]